MGSKITTCYVDEETHKKCRAKGLNISKFLQAKMEEYLKTTDKATKLILKDKDNIINEIIDERIKQGTTIEDMIPFHRGLARSLQLRGLEISAGEVLVELKKKVEEMINEIFILWLMGITTYIIYKIWNN